MAAFEYVGRSPDTDGVVVTKGYADTQNAATLVTTSFVNNACTIAAANLVNSVWIDQQVANYSTQTQVSSYASANFIPLTTLGANSGLAQSNSSGNIPPGVLPTTMTTERVATSYNVSTSGTIYLSGTHTVTTVNNLREYMLASIPIPDPGYAWIPLPFATVTGRALGTASGSRFLGNGNSGLLTVSPAAGVSDNIYGAGVCTADTLPNLYQVIPAAPTIGSATPTTRPPVNGALTLNLYGCCWAGSNYQFSSTGLTFWVLVVPAG